MVTPLQQLFEMPVLNKYQAGVTKPDDSIVDASSPPSRYYQALATNLEQVSECACKLPTVFYMYTPYIPPPTGPPSLSPMCKCALPPMVMSIYEWTDVNWDALDDIINGKPFD